MAQSGKVFVKFWGGGFRSCDWGCGGSPKEGFNVVWSLLRSWLRPHRDISREKPPNCLSFFQFVHDTRQWG